MVPLHSRVSLREHAALFDTVYVSLWKHFNGASGAVLAGDATFIEGLFHERRMFGGSLPQAWPVVGFVSEFVDRYEDEYAKSWRAADELIALLARDGRFDVRKVPNGTSRFMLSISGVAPEVMAKRALRHDIVLPHVQPGASTLPMQVNPSILRMTPARIAEVLVEASRNGA